MKWHIIVLICISQMTNDIEHLFICLLAIYIVFFGNMSFQIHCPFFSWVIYLLLLLSCKSPFYIPGTYALLTDTCFEKVFLPFCRVFHYLDDIFWSTETFNFNFGVNLFFSSPGLILRVGLPGHTSRGTVHICLPLLWFSCHT